MAFTSVAESEEELREFVSRDNPKADLQELGGKHRKEISEEFIEQSRSDSNSPENSNKETDEDDQEYHRHD